MGQPAQEEEEAALAKELLEAKNALKGTPGPPKSPVKTSSPKSATSTKGSPAKGDAVRDVNIASRVAPSELSSASAMLLSPDQRPARRVPLMAHRRFARALDKLAQVRQSAIEAPDLAVDQVECRPWDRDDFTKRLHTFKTQWWFAKPQCLGPVECAGYGWCNVGRDLLSCKVCDVTFTLSTPLEIAFQSGEGGTMAARCAESLSSSHAPHCGWRGNPCSSAFAEALSLATQSTAVEAFKERYQGILAAGAHPALPSCLTEMFVVSELRARPNEFEDLGAAVLALVGWTARSGAEGFLHCEFCNRTLALHNFSGSTDPRDPFAATEAPHKKRRLAALSPNKEGDATRLDPFREHRWFCCWAQGREKQNGRDHTAGWETCAASLAPQLDGTRERMSAANVALSVQNMLRVFKNNTKK